MLTARTGSFSVINKRLFVAISISSGYWCIFEALNLRLHNWHYTGLPEQWGLRYAGYLFSYGTVIPAIYLTKELLCNLIPRDLTIRPVPISASYPRYAMITGVICLIAVFALPTVAFPLAWVFLTPIIDGYNYLRGYPSFAGQLRRGSLTGLVTSAAAGLICGLMWEAWNYRAVSKWIYTVPFFHNLKVFEMPLPGFVGFLFFGIETIAFIGLLEGIREKTRPVYVLAVSGLAFSLITFPLIDRYTVLRFATPLYR